MWESINGADSWYPNSPDLTKGTLADRSYINQLTYAPTTNGNAIVGTNDGNVQYGFGLGTGTANTATWVNVTGGNAKLPNRPIQDVAISPQNALVGYAAVGGFDENTKKTPGHVFQVTCTTFCSTFTWLNKTGNLPNIPVNSVIANPNAPKQVFAGTDLGLFYTDDITATTPVWLHFQNGLPNTMVWDMSIDRGATTLALFTRSRGAWAIPLPTASATQVTLFSDDFETSKGWTVSAATACTWTKDATASDAHSPTNSWTTHPYGDNCNTDVTSPAIAVPSGANTIRLSFWEKHDSESGADGGAGCPVRLRPRAAVDRRRGDLHEHRKQLRRDATVVLAVDDSGSRHGFGEDDQAAVPTTSRTAPSRIPFTRAGGSTTPSSQLSPGASPGLSVPLYPVAAHTVEGAGRQAPSTPPLRAHERTRT